MMSLLAAAVLPLWFCADFDSPAEYKGQRIELPMLDGAKVEGRTGNGYAFTSSKRRAENRMLRLSDYVMLKTFPSKDGSFVCWFKSADTNAQTGAAFSLGSFWSFRWGWNGDGFRIGPQRKEFLKFKKPIGKSASWRHFAATWNEKALCAYLDGEEILRKENVSLESLNINKGDIFRLGSGPEGTPYACGLVMDDVAIVSKALSQDEVKKLCSQKTPLRTAKKEMPEYEYFKDIPRPKTMDDPMVFSWGGHKNSTLEFLKKIGINTISVTSQNPNRARTVAEAGFCVNIRFENSGQWRRLWGDGGSKKIMEYANEALSQYKSLKAWRSTLVNSEVYNGNVIFAASSNELWRTWAKKLVEGGEVDFTLLRPLRLDYKTLGLAPYQGILPKDNPTLNTLLWFSEKGHPVYQVNNYNSKVIKRLNPENVVWSEPSPSAIGLDMISDWMYDYSTSAMMQEFAFTYGKARAQKTKYMPTFGGSYHGDYKPVGVHPTAVGKDGKPLKIGFAPSVDEMKIKCWMAIGATKVEALSFWDDGGWCFGAENAKKIAQDPAAVVPNVAEIDFADRFGSFMHNEYLPALKTFKGIENAPAPVAILKADETQFAGTERWTYYKYPRLLARTLTKFGVVYDTLYSREITPENLAKYKYVILPMGCALTKEHYDALCAVKDTTTIVTDLYCKLKFPNQESVPARFVDHHGRNNPKRLLTTAPFEEWAKKHIDELRKASAAWSDRDGLDAFTFVKKFPDGRKAVIVVNDAREERSLWPQFCTNELYRAIAAKNRITLHINTPAGEQVKTYDFKPAETKVIWLPSEK